MFIPVHPWFPFLMRLRLQSLTKRFGAHAVLDGVSLDLPEACALVLLGPSGGGKSTLLRLLGGLETPDAGVTELHGARLDFSDDEALRDHRARTGFVSQAHTLFPHLTAWQNVALPLQHVHGLAPGEAVTEADRWLARLQLAAHADKRPAALSGGQRQRVASPTTSRSWARAASWSTRRARNCRMHRGRRWCGLFWSGC
ncbi:MAG: ATP-binding cassette domain-containing protein [Limisphaerales bacterium]